MVEGILHADSTDERIVDALPSGAGGSFGPAHARLHLSSSSTIHKNSGGRSVEPHALTPAVRAAFAASAAASSLRHSRLRPASSRSATARARSHATRRSSIEAGADESTATCSQPCCGWRHPPRLLFVMPPNSTKCSTSGAQSVIRDSSVTPPRGHRDGTLQRTATRGWAAELSHSGAGAATTRRSGAARASRGTAGVVHTRGATGGP